MVSWGLQRWSLQLCYWSSNVRSVLVWSVLLLLKLHLTVVFLIFHVYVSSLELIWVYILFVVRSESCIKTHLRRPHFRNLFHLILIPHDILS